MPELVTYYFPDTETIRVLLPLSDISSVIEIFNMEGRKIYQETAAPNHTEINISAQTLESQICIIRVQTGDKQYCRKILIAK
jgi:hypothetical protein